MAARVLCAIHNKLVDAANANFAIQDTTREEAKGYGKKSMVAFAQEGRPPAQETPTDELPKLGRAEWCATSQRSCKRTHSSCWSFELRVGIHVACAPACCGDL